MIIRTREGDALNPDNVFEDEEGLLRCRIDVPLWTGGLAESCTLQYSLLGVACTRTACPYFHLIEKI